MPPFNAALLAESADSAALAALDLPDPLVISDDPGLLPGVPRTGFAEALFSASPVDTESLFLRLSQIAGGRALIVDMGWAVGTLQGATAIDHWGEVADRLTETGLAVLSLYDPALVIEEQMQAILRAHRQFLSASGLTDNPYWLPAALRQNGTLDEQLAHMLCRVVPAYAPLIDRRQQGQLNARGTTPGWLAPTRPGPAQATGPVRWHIHCLGRLRVFIGPAEVDWHQPGGAPKKTRALFAYLLQSGDKGAHADQIGEFLWSEDTSEDLKRSRLHHTVAMLRRAFGDAGAVQREGEYYRLNAPPGSWIDIDTFEQLCRRGLALYRRGELAAALRIYGAADQLYGGDLFEDLPLDYFRSDTDDWCMPRRIWLREMAVKLQYDFAKVCLASGRSREALEHCQKALAIDPTSEGANAEAMKIFVSQGRTDAMHRHYRQYRAALQAIGAPEGAEIRALYRDLSQGAEAAKEKPKRTLIP